MVNIMNKIVDILKQNIKDAKIYLSPSPIVYPTMEKYEIQVVDRGSSVLDHNGCVVRVAFTVGVALFTRLPKDAGGRYDRILSDTTESILEKEKKVITCLDGEYLDDMLARPLVYMQESAVQETGPGFLLKVVEFTGGVNRDFGGE